MNAGAVEKFLRPGERRLPEDRKGPTCASCSAFMADVAGVKTDQGPKPLCWICRHAVVWHGIALDRAWDANSVNGPDGELVRIEWTEDKICMCTRRRYYPADVIAARIKAEPFESALLSAAS